MALNLDSTNIQKIYLGATQINKAYLGGTLVFTTVTEVLEREYTIKIQDLREFETTQGLYSYINYWGSNDADSITAVGQKYKGYSLAAYTRGNSNDGWIRRMFFDESGNMFLSSQFEFDGSNCNNPAGIQLADGVVGIFYTGGASNTERFTKLAMDNPIRQTEIQDYGALYGSTSIQSRGALDLGDCSDGKARMLYWVTENGRLRVTTLVPTRDENPGTVRVQTADWGAGGVCEMYKVDINTVVVFIDNTSDPEWAVYTFPDNLSTSTATELARGSVTGITLNGDISFAQINATDYICSAGTTLNAGIFRFNAGYTALNYVSGSEVSIGSLVQKQPRSVVTPDGKMLFTIFRENSTGDGFAQSCKIEDDTLTLEIESVEFDKTNLTQPSRILCTDDNNAYIAYGGSGTDGYVQAFSLGLPDRDYSEDMVAHFDFNGGYGPTWTKDDNAVELSIPTNIIGTPSFNTARQGTSSAYLKDLRGGITLPATTTFDLSQYVNNVIPGMVTFGFWIMKNDAVQMEVLRIGTAANPVIDIDQLTDGLKITLYTDNSNYIEFKESSSITNGQWYYCTLQIVNNRPNGELPGNGYPRSVIRCRATRTRSNATGNEYASGMGITEVGTFAGIPSGPQEVTIGARTGSTVGAFRLDELSIWAGENAGMRRYDWRELFGSNNYTTGGDWRPKGLTNLDDMLFLLRGDGAGGVYDVLGNHTPTITGSITFSDSNWTNVIDGAWTPGTYGYITIPDHPDFDFTNGFTIVAQIKPTANPAVAGYIMEKRSGIAADYTTDREFNLVLNASNQMQGGPVDENSDVGYVYNSQDDITNGSWRFVTMTFDPSTNQIVMYKNGNPQYIEEIITAGFVSMVPGGADIHIGNLAAAAEDSTARNFVGEMTCVGLFNRVLTHEEVSQYWWNQAVNGGHGDIVVTPDEFAAGRYYFAAQDLTNTGRATLGASTLGGGVSWVNGKNGAGTNALRLPNNNSTNFNYFEIGDNDYLTFSNGSTQDIDHSFEIEFQYHSWNVGNMYLLSKRGTTTGGSGVQMEYQIYIDQATKNVVWSVIDNSGPYSISVMFDLSLSLSTWYNLQFVYDYRQEQHDRMRLFHNGVEVDRLQKLGTSPELYVAMENETSKFRIGVPPWQTAVSDQTSDITLGRLGIYRFKLNESQVLDLYNDSL